MAYWQQLSGIQEPIPIRQFNGVYKPDDEGFNLADGLFTELINFCPDEFPALKTRPGYTVVGTFGTGVLGMGLWKDLELHVIFNNGTWQKLNANGTWTSLATGLSTTARASFVNFKGNLTDMSLIMANGVDVVKYYNGSTVQNLANAPPNTKYIEQHDNRVYLVNENLVRFSALNKPTDWTTNNDAGEILVQSSDGEIISAVKSGPKHLVVFKPNSMYDLLGTGPTSYTLIPIAADIGAINNNCTVNIGGLIYFLHTTGVYSYASARPKKDFCNPIMAYIKRINQSALSQCSIGSDGLNLFVSLPLDTSNVPNIILQYNLERGAWYTWSDYTAVNFAFMKGINYVGNANGSVRKVGGTTNNGTAIVQTAITKPFTAEVIARKSHWLKIWVVASISSGSTISVYISGSASGEDWRLSKTITAESNIQYKEILIPTSSVSSANAVRLKLVATGTVSIHEITRQTRSLPMRR
jgi:hypothetical protein